MTGMTFREENLALFLWLCRERYEIKLRRDEGRAYPWTKDPILAGHHFCNVFRRDDKTSVVIHRLIREQVGKQDMLRAAILARVVNKHSTIPGAWAIRNAEPNRLEECLKANGINTNAYRLNTPKGLNSFAGVAELALTDTGSWGETLAEADSLRRAHELMCAHSRIGSFVVYQVILDLLDCGYWAGPFDSSWALAGPGAYRGGQFLRGDERISHWESGDFRPDRDEKLQAEMPALLAEATERVGSAWPADWPRFTVHETEFMLCELDKYVRQRAGTGGGRRYRPPEPQSATLDLFGG